MKLIRLQEMYAKPAAVEATPQERVLKALEVQKALALDPKYKPEGAERAPSNQFFVNPKGNLTFQLVYGILPICQFQVEGEGTKGKVAFLDALIAEVEKGSLDKDINKAVVASRARLQGKGKGAKLPGKAAKGAAAA